MGYRVELRRRLLDYINELELERRRQMAEAGRRAAVRLARIFGVSEEVVTKQPGEQRLPPLVESERQFIEALRNHTEAVITEIIPPNKRLMLRAWAAWVVENGRRFRNPNYQPRLTGMPPIDDERVFRRWWQLNRQEVYRLLAEENLWGGKIPSGRRTVTR